MLALKDQEFIFNLNKFSINRENHNAVVQLKIRINQEKKSCFKALLIWLIFHSFN